MSLHGEPPGRRAAAMEIAMTAAVFFVHAGWPVPDVNEPHYLSKCRHFWDEQWCRGDFFLESADAHWFFFGTCGWPSQYLPLSVFAWVGRWLTWFLLAWSIVRLSRLLVGAPWSGVLVGGLFVALMERMHMSGEWVVGGFEAKGVAYALVFLGLESALGGRWNRAWCLLGGATALHVLVGGWSLILTAGIWVLENSKANCRLAISGMIPGAAAGSLLALAGLLPAVALSWGVDRSVLEEANRIYVFERLPHHLALLSVPREEVAHKIARLALLLVGFAVFCRLAPADRRHRSLRWFVCGAAALALTGLLIEWALRDEPLRAAGWLRFYWYRMIDTFLPLSVSITLVWWIRADFGSKPNRATCLLAACLLLAVGHLVGVVKLRHADPTPRADTKMRAPIDWRTACRWIDLHLPSGAVCLTPRSSQSFKWYAQRAEIVTRKDVPQDAVGIVEWWQRINTVFASDDPSYQQYISSLALRSEGELRWLARKYGAQYLVTASEPPLLLPRLYANDSYAVYALSE